MKKQWVLIVLALCLSLFGSTHASLAQGSNDTLARMQREGWKIVKDGVLQRELRAGQVETFVFGVPGFTWKLQDLQNQLRNLRVRYAADPKPELRRAILNHRQEIANTQRMIELARLSEASGQTGIEKVSCNIGFGYNATASYQTSVQGTVANATANFSSNCAFYGEVYAYAYTAATVNGALVTNTFTDGPRSGANVSASAYASVNGAPSCESYAYGSMVSNSLNPSSYSMSSQNYNCPVPTTPLSVTVTSNAPSTTIDLYNSDCTTISWTTNISGGTSPYTSTMYLNGASQGTRTTYSKSYCNAGTNTSLTASVSATVTDSGSPVQSQSASAPTLTIRSHAVVAPPPPSISIASNYPSTINLYEDDCVTITWTATISGGTSPYTKNWFVNNVAQTNHAISHSATYCNVGTNSSKIVTVYASVTDSSSPVQTATSATNSTTIVSHRVYVDSCGTNGQICP